MKKWLSILVTAVMAVATVTFSGCGHTHTYEEEWRIDAYLHWKKATCEHSDEYKDMGEHQYDPNKVCIVCGYQKMDFEFTLSENGKSYILTGLQSFEGSTLIIPSEHEGLPVSEIGANALMGDFTLVSIPESIERIGYQAFADNPNLKTVVIGNGVTVIEAGAFLDCVKLEKVVFGNNVKEVYSEAFKNCKSLKEVRLNSKLSTIGSVVFDGCSSLTTIEIPYSVSTIGWSAFGNMPKLTDIYCARSSEPEGWDVDWNMTEAYVHWGNDVEDNTDESDE